MPLIEKTPIVLKAPAASLWYSTILTVNHYFTTQQVSYFMCD